ncbi:hypothetical protein KQI68_07430 [Peptoniphilus sp. MSJ-1]|uniref:Uncharacterized protein n=1 Tax=Peptoniphilus ovalis TaxID=2841503 RepID=A0ABS6FI63_9FIRM|nr:hypothetical protein [Peptoniphilus ovalis]MBU5669671.1 hypothetical protein [Peptoniphilus ovalis]
MAEQRKYLDEQGLRVLSEVNKELFVQKESGKSLTDENYTRAEKEKLATLQPYSVATSTADGLMSTVDKAKIDKIAEGAEVNAINKIKKNGVNVPIQDKEIDIKVPVNVSELVNDSEFMNKADFDTAVKEALATIGSFKTEVVAELPATETAKENTLYLVNSNTGDTNIYKEYLFVNGKFELIGDTAVDIDLSSYLRKDEITAFSAEEIRTILNA